MNDEEVEAFKQQKLEELGPGAEDIIKRVDGALNAIADKRPDDADLIERLKNDGKVTDIVHDLIVSLQPNPETDFKPAATGAATPSLAEIREAMAEDDYHENPKRKREVNGWLEAYADKHPNFRAEEIAPSQ